MRYANIKVNTGAILTKVVAFCIGIRKIHSIHKILENHNKIIQLISKNGKAFLKLSIEGAS